MKAHYSLLKTALLHGLTFTVDDGEETIQFTGYAAAVKAIEGVEEARVHFSDGEQAYILPYGVGDDETVADWTTVQEGEPDNWIDQWSNKYFADNRYPATGPQEVNINALHGDDI